MNRSAFLGLGAAAVVGCTTPRASATATLLDIDAFGEPLRTAFNRDVHDVRILMLVSPT